MESTVSFLTSALCRLESTEKMLRTVTSTELLFKNTEVMP
jgi:hypothetical protein